MRQVVCTIILYCCEKHVLQVFDTCKRVFPTCDNNVAEDIQWRRRPYLCIFLTSNYWNVYRFCGVRDRLRVVPSTVLRHLCCQDRLYRTSSSRGHTGSRRATRRKMMCGGPSKFGQKPSVVVWREKLEKLENYLTQIFAT